MANRRPLVSVAGRNKELPSADAVLADGATLVNRTAASVPTPASGTVTVFSEGGVLKQKDSAGVVTQVTNDVGGGLSHGQVLRRIELLER